MPTHGAFLQRIMVLYSECDVDQILEKLQTDPKALKRHRWQYKGLLTQKNAIRVCLPYVNLVLDRTDGRKFSQSELKLLLGPQWESIKEKNEEKKTEDFEVLGRHGFTYNLAGVEQEKQICEHFDILGQNRGIRGLYSKEIPPMLNLALSLTLTACHEPERRGVFLWQPKFRSTRSHNSKWSRVPDIIYWDLFWTEAECERFLTSGYREQRECLCASLRLDDEKAIVLPFVVDFDGIARQSTDNAQITADVDGHGAPKAGISIPGAAYIGWYSQMSPPENDADIAKLKWYLPANRCRGARWLLSPEQRRETRVVNLVDMVRAAQEMYDNPQQGAIVRYKSISYLVNEADRELSWHPSG